MTRGMDVEGVRNVINYDMPTYTKTFIHCAGWTARAGQTGRCFTLLLKAEVKRFNKPLRKAENNSCSKYSVPSSYIEPLHSIYESALEKLKETVEMETSRKRKRWKEMKQSILEKKVIRSKFCPRAKISGAVFLSTKHFCYLLSRKRLVQMT